MTLVFDSMFSKKFKKIFHIFKNTSNYSSILPIGMVRSLMLAIQVIS